MKKVILAIVMLMGISTASNAQMAAASPDMKNGKMKEGVMMSNGQVMLCNGKKCAKLKKTYTCSDGCKISPDGTVTKPDGMTMKLMNGYEIGKDGKMMMIPHGQPGHVCGKDCPMYGKM